MTKHIEKPTGLDPEGVIPTPPVDGIHQWLIASSRLCKVAGIPMARVIESLVSYEPELRRPYEVGEVERTVRWVFQSKSDPFREGTSLRRVGFDPAKLAKIAKRTPEVDEAWFKARSPMPVDAVSTDDYLRAITLPGEKVLCFNDYKSQGQFVFEHTDEPAADGSTLATWRDGLDDGAWFLSNPVSGRSVAVARLKGPHNPDGKSRRCEECVTSFRYAVLESDLAEPRAWLAALAQIPLPIVSVTTSGGKSIHALVLINASSKGQWDKIVRTRLGPTLVTLGADAAALTAVRLTRLPGVHRGTRLQELLYLNPEPTGQSIHNLNSSQSHEIA